MQLFINFICIYLFMFNYFIYYFSCLFLYIFLLMYSIHPSMDRWMYYYYHIYMCVLFWLMDTIILYIFIHWFTFYILSISVFSTIVSVTCSFIWSVSAQYFSRCGCDCDPVCIYNLIYLSFVSFATSETAPHSKHRALCCVLLRLSGSPPVSSTDHIIGNTWVASGSHGCRRTRPPLRCWVCFLTLWTRCTLTETYIYFFF